MTTDTHSRVVAARLDSDLVERLERVAAADHRSLGNTIRVIIMRGLPSLEREVLGDARPTVPTEEEAS